MFVSMSDDLLEFSYSATGTTRAPTICLTVSRPLLSLSSNLTWP